ncbi:MAG: catalase [Actinomycetota bacterium]|nr:catalase [Actinomycetota bacterium]
MPSQANQANRTPAPDLADQLVDDLIRACPAHRLGTRPIHAPGIAATGWFSPSPVASSFTTAEHFAGGRVPVTVRFSNGTGDADEPDSTPAVRGMAVKFHVGPTTRDEWGVLHSEVETDLVAMTLPMFFVKDVERFRKFVVAATPVLPKARSPFKKLIEALRLDTPYPTPPLGTPSSEPGIFEFAAHYPPACPAVAYLGGKFVPESYTTCSYHAVHAFALTAPDASTRLARFHWEPVDGVQSAPPGAEGNFLRGGLKDRITNGHAEFVLRIQLAEQGDDPADSTRPWPVQRPRVVMGQLRLTDVPEDQFHGCELLSFNPTRLVPGIGLSSDPLLAARGEVYDRSSARRLQATEAATHTDPVEPYPS